ncbi:IclR family transcriptional regulator [Sphingomonas sp. IC081]|uniref:IclR family transcriptional regulator n=1 Tax=Sphingomonas sp. IC081 TaxID=304378 RepID=UPI0011581202|nr:IclR family transcriptional regulator [Sphingomonas sp. IC081]QDK35697.1 IclR family transcriptional regulator [Sphingomonas sp. IC081]
MSVPALERGVSILRMFRRDRASIAAPEIATELGLARSSVHSLLNALVDLGLLRRLPNGRFALDAGVLTLGFEYLGSLAITDLASSILERLRDQTDWSSHLAVRQGRSIVYLSRFASRQAITRNVAVGTSLPAHSTVMGRILLSDLEPTALRALYAEEWDNLIESRRATSFADFMAMLRADRERGYAASNGFHEPGVGVVAAPVRDASLQIVAAINAVAVGDHGSGMEQATSHVLAAARELSRLLGAPATMPEAGDTLLERQI